MPQTRKTTPARKAKAVEKLSELVDARDKAEKLADRARHRMYRGVLKSFDAGLTYAEIAEITGLSKIRVSQVLAEQRGV